MLPGDDVTFTADVLWRLYRREETLPVFKVLHVNEDRASVLVKDGHGVESALSLELLVPTNTSWDTCRRMLRLAETPEQLIGFMRWHAAGCSVMEKPSAPAATPPAPDGTGWPSRLRKTLAVIVVLTISVACPPLGLVALLASWVTATPST